MDRFEGTVSWLAPAPGWEAVRDWVVAIPWEDWPQQTRLADGMIRPAMVTDLAWHDFGKATWDLVRHLGGLVGGVSRNRMLSAVMPGAAIDPHADARSASTIARVHVPLLTNDSAWVQYGGEVRRMHAGDAYLVNTEVTHAAVNEGTTPRVHLTFEVHQQQ